jgi:hypothetical protein
MIRQAIDTNNNVDRTSELAEQWIKHPPVKKVITIKAFIKNIIALFKRNKTDDPFIYL